MRGIVMSISTTSGCSDSASSTASSPFWAQPTTSKRSSSARMASSERAKEEVVVGDENPDGVHPEPNDCRPGGGATLAHPGSTRRSRGERGAAPTAAGRPPLRKLKQ